MKGRFQQTEAPQVRVHLDEDGENEPDSINVHITRPGVVTDPETHRQNRVRQTFISGSIRRTQEGWEPDDDLRVFLGQVRESDPPTGWPDMESATQDIEEIIVHAWQRAQQA